MFFEFSAKRKTTQERGGGGFSFYRPPVAGVNVDDVTAFTYSPFFACMRIISETVGFLPWHVMEGGTKRQIAREHPLDPVLYTRANDEMNSFIFRELSVQHVLGWGNSYAEIERNRAGEIVNLWPLDPSRVNTDRDSNGRLFYEVSGGGMGKTSLKPKDVFHVRGPSRDGINGYSIIDLAKESISLGLAAEAFGSGFFGNGAIPGAVIKNDGGAKLNETGVSNLLKTFNKKNQGARQAFKTNYLDPGLSLEVIGVSPDNAQFLETRKFQVNEIARWFRIPPHKLADLERSTHSNIEAQNIEFVTDAVLPWVTRFEQQTNFSLISDPSRYYNKMNVLGLLRGDSKTRAEYYKTLANLGVLSIDEIRDKEDMDSIGHAGNLRLVPLNMTTPEKMQNGDTGNNSRVNNTVNSLVNEIAQRFTKIEVNRTRKLAEKGDKSAIAEFYVNHARNLADGFFNSVSLCFEINGAGNDNLNGFLSQFFGDYVSESADNLQNAIQTGRLNALFCNWEARKAENLARDLLTSIQKEAKANV